MIHNDADLFVSIKMSVNCNCLTLHYSFREVFRRFLGQFDNFERNQIQQKYH